MAAEIKHCTSCGSKEIEVAGNKYLCRECGIVYEVTDTGTKALNTDPLGEDRARISSNAKDIAALKEQRGGSEPDPEPAAEPEPDDDPEPAEDEDEDEMEGFVSW